MIHGFCYFYVLDLDSSLLQMNHISGLNVVYHLGYFSIMCYMYDDNDSCRWWHKSAWQQKLECWGIICNVYFEHPQKTSKVRLIYWIQNTPNILRWAPNGFHLKGLKLWTKKLGCQQVIIVMEGKKYQNKTHSGKR